MSRAWRSDASDALRGRPGRIFMHSGGGPHESGSWLWDAPQSLLAHGTRLQAMGRLEKQIGTLLTR